MLSFSYLPTLCIVLSLLSTVVRGAPIAEEDLHTVELKPQCQALKTRTANPLEGCPRGTVFVSQKHPRAEYRTINAAVSAL